MSIQEIRYFGDPVLTTPASAVVDFDKELRVLVKDLTDTMLDAPGAGLAAPQIGVPLRVFVWDVDEALGHESNIEYYDNNTRYPHQMDEYDAALNLFIDVTPVKNSTRNHNVRTANSCSADGSSCLSGNHCCQGGCSTSGTCICQAQNDWCFNYGGPDSYCCSNVCGVNGRCKCIQKGKSCAVGGEHCCSGLVCDEHSLICTENASQPSGKPSAKPTQAPKSNTLTGRPTPIETNGRPTVACIDISVEIKTGKLLCITAPLEI